MEGIYTYTQGDVGAEWTIYPSCVPTVGDLRDNLELPGRVPAARRAELADVVSGGDARLTGGQWDVLHQHEGRPDVPGRQHGADPGDLQVRRPHDDRHALGDQQRRVRRRRSGRTSSTYPFTLAFKQAAAHPRRPVPAVLRARRPEAVLLSSRMNPDTLRMSALRRTAPSSAAGVTSSAVLAIDDDVGDLPRRLRRALRAASSETAEAVVGPDGGVRRVGIAVLTARRSHIRVGAVMSPVAEPNRLARYQRRTEWWLALIALVFLALYSVDVLAQAPRCGGRPGSTGR